MNIERFEKDMAVFSFGQHQDVLTYLTHLKAKGWTVEDAKEWVAGKKKDLVSRQRKAEEYIKLSLICPLCSTQMRLLPVNISKETLTNDDSKSVWLCPNKACMNTIYNRESIDELIRKGGT